LLALTRASASFYLDGARWSSDGSPSLRGQLTLGSDAKTTGPVSDVLESASMVHLRDITAQALQPILADPAEGQWDHVYICDREDFLARMRRADFKTAVFAPFESCSTAAEALHLNPLEVLSMETKPEDGSR
jgi:hypothetical protein